MTMLFLITELPGLDCRWCTLTELIRRLEDIITCENVSRVKIMTLGTERRPIDNYRFMENGAYLQLDKDALDKIMTPTIKLKLMAELQNKYPQKIKSDDKPETSQHPLIKQKLDYERLDNMPQTVQQVKVDDKPYLLIKGDEVQPKSFAEIQKEVSKMSVDEIKKITIYMLSSNQTYKYSPEKLLFVNKDDTLLLPHNLTEHLICTYKMLIVSAEDPNNPFELTKKYMCEKKVLIRENEWNEMYDYYQDHFIEFKRDGLFKGYLVRVFLIKNNIIIGEINDRGLFYKNYKKDNTQLAIRQAIKSYIAHVYEFREKPREEIEKIYNKMMIYQKVYLCGLRACPNDADEMVNIMVKRNEFEMMLIKIE
jgi:hypothetical protein